MNVLITEYYYYIEEHESLVHGGVGNRDIS